MSSEGMPTERLSDGGVRWEYGTSMVDVQGFIGPRLDVDRLNQELNSAGEQGWEVISVVALDKPNGQAAKLLVVMKRPLWK